MLKISLYAHDSRVRDRRDDCLNAYQCAGDLRIFTEGYVTYSNEAKVKMIHVKPETIERYGVVSAETAADMAVSAARTADTDAALSVTGVAGPDGGTRECPVGLVYIGCRLHGRVVTERHLFAGDRMQVRKSATDAALHLLARTITEEGTICES